MCISIMSFFYFLVLFYFMNLTPIWLVLAMAAVSAILLYKMCKILQFICRFVNSAHDALFCTCWPILRKKILRTQNCRILTSLCKSTLLLTANVSSFLRPNFVVVH